MSWSSAILVKGRSGSKPRLGEQAGDLRLAVGHVDQHRAGDLGQRRLEQSQRRAGLARDDGTHVGRGAARARQEEAVAAGIVPGQRSRPGEQVGEDGRPVRAERGAVELGDLGDVAERRQIVSLGTAAPPAPARQRLDGAEAHALVHRPPGRCRVEERDEPTVAQLRERALHQARREPAPPVGAVHDDHADPAECRRIRQREAGRNEATLGAGNAEGAAEADQQ